jgi:putative salt-induced outer membrane protein
MVLFRCFRVSTLVGTLLAVSVPAVGDVVVLNNEDRISGTVVESNREVLTIQSELMGEVTVPWDAIVDLMSESELYVQTMDGQIFAGTVATDETTLGVETELSGLITVPIAAVESIRSEERQNAYEAEIERLQNPGLLDFWSGVLDAGYSLVGGNASSATLSTSSRIERRTERDRISIYYTQLYSRNELSSGLTETTANAIRGGSRYDIDVAERLFTFAFADLEFDEFQDLDLRNVLGGGMGYHVIESENLSVDFFSGGSFNQEFFNNDITRRSGELVFGGESDYDLRDGTNWTQRLVFYPNLSEMGDYRLQYDTSVATELNDWLAWQISFSDRLLSNPPVGRVKNDTLFSTGLRFSFGLN